MVSVLAFLGCVWLFSVISYLLYYFFNAWVTAKPKDVKGMYGGVEWALVTGGSSGIGAALSEELCQQGINVVIVAKKDAMLEETTSRLEKDFPERRIVSVGVDLGDSNGSYMKAIKEATEELPIKVVINNAGYIRVGHFINDPCEAALHNNEVNVISALRITHHFTNRMIDENLKGFVCFTSSCASFIPCPMSTIYGGSKAFLTNFATSLAAELRPCGIDVMVVHPSPVSTNFYPRSQGLSIFQSLEKIAVTPNSVARSILSSVVSTFTKRQTQDQELYTTSNLLFAVITGGMELVSPRLLKQGNCTVKDLGPFTVGTRVVLKVLDFNVLSELVMRTAAMSDDYWKLKRKRGEQKAK